MTLIALPVATFPTVGDLLRPARPVLDRLTSRTLALTVLVVLAGGTTLSIVTTTYPAWWQLHFSELGTFDDFSGRAFNTTLIITGTLIPAFAARVHADVRALTPARSVRASRVFPILMASVGINMAGVGMIPLNSNPFLHDRAASGIMLSFLGMLVVVFVRTRHVPRVLLVATLSVAVGLACAITLFVTGIFNLAALEIVGFTMIFVWIGILVWVLGRAQHLHRTGALDAELVAEGDAAASSPASPVVRRHVARPRRLAPAALMVGGEPMHSRCSATGTDVRLRTPGLVARGGRPSTTTTARAQGPASRTQCTLPARKQGRSARALSTTAPYGTPFLDTRSVTHGTASVTEVGSRPHHLTQRPALVRL